MQTLVLCDVTSDEFRHHKSDTDFANHPIDLSRLLQRDFRGVRTHDGRLIMSTSHGAVKIKPLLSD